MILPMNIKALPQGKASFTIHYTQLADSFYRRIPLPLLFHFPLYYDDFLTFRTIFKRFFALFRAAKRKK
jgi:hypothetical protein